MASRWISLGFETCERGVSSAVGPELLPDNQTAWMLNGQNRGGKPATRPNFAFCLSLPPGLIQGGEFFGVQGGMLVVSIAGRMYRIRINNRSFAYEEITLGFRNSALVKQVWMTQTVETLVIQDGQSNPILYDGSTAERAITGEVPRGRMMGYGNGRLWVAVNANEVVAGDIRTSAPGSELIFSEANYLSGGGRLFFTDPLTGLAFIPVTGQADYGELMVFGASSTNAIRADITARDDWAKIPGFVRSILRSVGASCQWSIASVNQDLYWRDSNSGIRSIRNALADEAGPGSSPISREVSRLTAFDSQRQQAFCSSVYHDNRLLMTSSPFLLGNGGVGWKNLIALDFAPLSTMQGKSQAAYDGQWSGLNFVKLLGGRFRGKNRAFSLVTNDEGNNELWEFGTGERADMIDLCDGTGIAENPITCLVEYPLRNFGQSKIRKRLERCDLWLAQVDGDIDLKVYWRSDNSVQWLQWDEATTCAKTTDPEGATPHIWKNLSAQERPQFKTFTIPDSVNDLVKYASQVGFEFQVRIVWTGRMKVHRMMLYGTLLNDPDYADRTGFEIECVQQTISGNEVIYAIPGCPPPPDCVLTITSQPENLSIQEESDGSFVVAASIDPDTDPTTIQWQVSDGTGWENITDGTGGYSGATTGTLLIIGSTLDMSGLQYRAVITGPTCEVESDPATLTVTEFPSNLVQYLVAGEGGDGGSGYGGGGGGGAVIEGTTNLVVGDSYPIVVGTGGYPVGASSSFAGITAPGGGYGGGYINGYGINGQGGYNGGGGGVSEFGVIGSGGIGSSGRTGGVGLYPGGDNLACGGGAGMGGHGGDWTFDSPYWHSGDGASGVSSSISGVAAWYGAGGGGGGVHPLGGPYTGGIGGNTGVGGSGSSGEFLPQPGMANTGSGGGGAKHNQAGGAGADGVVFVRYTGAPLYSGGTITSVGGDTVHRFTTSGTLTPL